MGEAHNAVEAAPFAPFERDAAFDDLRDLMKSERPPIALVGAGASEGSGYVSWKALVEEMEREAGAGDIGVRWKAALASFNDAPWTAEVHRKAMGEVKFQALIRKQFDHRDGLGEPHLTLAKMRFRHFLTTNFDPCIEASLERAGLKPRRIHWTDHEDLSSFLINLGQPKEEKAVVYLHGRYDRPEEVVLTESAYVERYISSDDARRKLLAIFMTHPVVFVGFSMNDPDFANLMREVTARLKAKPPAHFALLAYSSSEEREAYAARMEDKFGVRPVFYSRITKPGADEFGNLIPLLDALAGQKARTASAAALATPVAKPGKRPKPPANDPQKGQWGGRAEANGRRLRAENAKLDGRWLRFDLVVEATDERPLDGKVEFFLHDSFDQAHQVEKVKNGKARLHLTTYGAFTVGAVADGGDTQLELDLSLQSDLPLGWRQR
jgi:hypothetical protein